MAGLQLRGLSWPGAGVAEVLTVHGDEQRMKLRRLRAGCVRKKQEQKALRAVHAAAGGGSRSSQRSGRKGAGGQNKAGSTKQGGQVSQVRRTAQTKTADLPQLQPVFRPAQDTAELNKARSGGRQRSAKKSAKLGALYDYLTRFKAALAYELEEELEQVESRIKTWSNSRLLREGFALFNLRVSSDGRVYKDELLRFSPGDNGPLPPYYRFRPGDIVYISQRNPLEEDERFEGVVAERARRFLQIAVPANQAASIVSVHGGKWRVDFATSSVTHARACAALDTLAEAPPNQRAPLRDIILQFTLDGDSSAESMTMMADCTSPWAKGAAAGQLRGELRRRLDAAAPTTDSGAAFDSSAGLQRMNDSQKKAIEVALQRRLTLWQGPPGTGKTHTVVRFIALCRQLTGHQVLACADSNVAVDNMVSGLVGLGVRVVRIGQPVKMQPALRQRSLEALVAAHPKVQEIASQQVQRKRWSRSDQQLMEAVEDQVAKQIIDNADVVAATCVGAGGDILAGRKFRLCVIDEATQATEPVCIIPLSLGVESALLVGDPKQLPPTVISQKALEARLDISLYERLETAGVAPMLLNTQYRMHPSIAEFPSQTFYSNRLISFPTPEGRTPPAGFAWPDSTRPLAFIQCLGVENSRQGSPSYFNQREADLVLNAVQGLLANGAVTEDDIGIISPYSAQVALLLETCQASGIGDNLEIATVDGFQGREKEVIIISTVRSNSRGQLGFLVDPRRLNVALTRAKRGVIVAGNAATLRSNPIWSSWLDWMRSQGLCMQNP
eukprot:jgi/Chlat1/1513/Chrsp12S02079